MDVEEMKAIVEDRVKDLMTKYEDAAGDTGKYTPYLPDVVFKIKSVHAGMSMFNYSVGHGILDFNIELMESNFDKFLRTTVTHEVAHYCCSLLHGRLHSRSGRRNVHGKPWKDMMNFFGIDTPKRCHSYDTSVVSTRRQRKFKYNCDCGYDHKVSTTLHNKIQKKGQTRCCNTCRSEIVFSHEIK